MVSDKSSWFSIFRKISQVRTCNKMVSITLELSRSMLVMDQNCSIFKPRFIRTSSRWSVFTLEGLWMFSDRIVDFQFFDKFHMSGPAIIFNFWTITEHVSYASKKLLIKPKFVRTSSRWWKLLRKNYGWFQLKFLIFDSSSNFTGPGLQ